MRAVLGLDPAAATDRVGEQEDGLARDRRTGPGRRRERERRLECFGPAAQRVGQHAVDLRQSAVDRAALAVEPLAAGGDEAEDDDDRLVLGQHQRRQPVAGPDAVPAADSALALDRDPELLERLDVPADGPRIDVERGGDLAPGRQRPRLEELEQLEEPGRRRRARPPVKQR